MKNYNSLLQKIVCLSLMIVSSIIVTAQSIYISEDIQDWTNRTKYGEYTQTIAVGSSTGDVILTNCIVASGAVAREECSVGRIQIRETDGVVELPEVPSVSIVKLGLVAGAQDREISLQYYKDNTWTNLCVIDNISAEGKLFSFNLNLDVPTRLRLTAASKTVYLHDIEILGGESNCISSNLHFQVSDTITKYVGNANFVISALTDNKIADITYSSSNPKVATVDAKTGEVKVLSIGTTKIQALQKEGSYEDVDYCMASASYILKVGLESKALLSVERTFTDFKTYAGGKCTATLTVKGANLKSNIMLALKGKDALSFKLSETSLIPVDGIVDNKEITISYEPYVAKADIATLVISSNSALGIEIELLGSATNLVGEGTENNPFLVSDVKALNNRYASSSKYWVQGYIVGIPTQGNTNGNLTIVKNELPFVGQTAIAIADIENEQDLSKMVGVQLPKGSIRDALNLEDNAGNFNKKILVYGTLEAYFSNAPGIKNVTEYQFDLTSVHSSNEANTKVFVDNKSIIVDVESGSEVQIYNLLGKQLYNSFMDKGKHQIHHLETGVYIVKIANFVTKICLF